MNHRNRISGPFAAGSTLVLAAAALLLFAALSVPAAAQGPVVETYRPGRALLSSTSVFTQYLPLAYDRINVPTLYGVEMTWAGSTEINMASALSMYHTRRNGLLWSDIEPVQGGGYLWANAASLDADLLAKIQAGMHPILVVRSTPDWAQKVPGSYCGPVKQENFVHFGNFMAEVVKRYGGPPFYIRYFEIWNEPDVDPSLVPPDELFGCWGDKNDPYYGGRYYGQMLKVVYPKIKNANPEALVMIGGLLMDCDPRNPPAGKNCTPSKYLEGILVAGAKNSFDGVSFHAYDHYNWELNTFGNPNWHSGKLNNEPNGVLQPVLVTKAAFIREVLNAFNAKNKFLMNTEVALLCGGNFDPPGGPGCEAVDSSPYEQMKKAYASQAFAAALGEGLTGNIWFTMRGWRNSGLIYLNKEPRPAYHAVDFSQSMLWNGKMIGPVTGYTKVKGYKFARELSSTIWVMWATGGSPRSIDLPSVPVAIWDSTGNPVAVNGTTVILNTAPYYIQMP